MPSHKTDPTLIDLARSEQSAKAAENGLTVVAADVAGRQSDHVAYGCTNIIDPNGQVIASSKPLVEDLLIAEIELTSPTRFRGWDAAKNPAIVQAYQDSCYTEIEPYTPTPVQK